MLGFVGYCWVLAGKVTGKVKKYEYQISYEGLLDKSDKIQTLDGLPIESLLSYIPPSVGYGSAGCVSDS